MIIYVSATPAKDVNKISTELHNKGHVAIGGEGLTKDQRKSLIAVCDAMVLGEPYNVDDKMYADRLGLPTYDCSNLPDKHPTEMRCPNQAEAFRELLGKMYRVHLQKNADYSPANIAGTGEVGLATRMWDKMARLMNLSGFNLKVELLSFNQPKSPKNESIEDTLMDMAVYALINLLYRAGKWGN